ncbi:D-alanine--D-alanine ligase family protein [Phytohabitans flavus]|uniref:D-alanine--D-alanine ligase n=1 Tax=Phytohabitans flavus TaxID=1076124 RepID=A0A6F8XMD9_9ACTN|nr:D-alanine--D-alanine ligase family protein [Phytohabitans flavus]BCB74980.1 D-alanine--D-alanine ligase [Phytohabitans flavus]
MSADSKVRVAVIFGGRSAEHGVSCSSAASIVRYLCRERYEVTPVRIDQDGVWTIGDDRPVLDGLDTATLLDMTRDPAGPRPTALESMWRALSRLSDKVDVAFPALHGGHGEDGTIQSALDFFGIPYVGSSVVACGIGMDKELTKKLLADARLRVADSVTLRGSADDVSPEDRARLGLPVFVKPAREGSSVGVSKVEGWASLTRAVAVARKTGLSKVLVEAEVPGREIDVGVLEYPDGRVVAGPPLEIRYPDEHSFFDFDAKYHSDQTIFDIPADLPAAVTAAVQAQAVEAFHVLGCAGLLRVDFFLPSVDGSEDPVVVVNEVNTMPGFTAMSQFPRMWSAAGLEYPALLDVLVETALARWYSLRAPRG